MHATQTEWKIRQDLFYCDIIPGYYLEEPVQPHQ